MKKFYRKMCRDRAVWVMTDQKKIIGSISLSIDPPQKNLAHIGALFVTPKYQGLGLSKYLYKRHYKN